MICDTDLALEASDLVPSYLVSSEPDLALVGPNPDGSDDPESMTLRFLLEYNPVWSLFEVVEDVPEVVEDVPEVVEDIPEVVEDVTEVVETVVVARGHRMMRFRA